MRYFAIKEQDANMYTKFNCQTRKTSNKETNFDFKSNISWKKRQYDKNNAKESNSLISIVVLQS